MLNKRPGSLTVVPRDSPVVSKVKTESLLSVPELKLNRVRLALNDRVYVENGRIPAAAPGSGGAGPDAAQAKGALPTFASI